MIVGAVFFFAAGLAVGIGIDGAGGESSSSLVEARENCAPDSLDIRIGDDGDTLIIDRAGAEENPGADYLDVLCIFDELGVPDSVTSQIEGTRALDGTQEADFGEYSAFWTYHPDDGLNMTITWNP
ncbi:hypothetical protein [Glycomyces arizonensis]|uniref:hypothetical protein n=1 Tax=Glycomyces arizonensis TaxID=256035 RepID=UPI0012EBB052|nr:hypothetical protein [Glycomyces arizonensis]